ncbi:MAG: hypothetical protein OHK0023_21280 [Anaerolineae bacterium]
MLNFMQITWDIDSDTVAAKGAGNADNMNLYANLHIESRLFKGELICLKNFTVVALSAIPPQSRLKPLGSCGKIVPSIMLP